jgi:hypothetical protein
MRFLRPGSPDRILLVTSLLAPLVLAIRIRWPGTRVMYLVRGDEILEARWRGRWLRAWLAGRMQTLMVRCGVEFVFVSWDLEALFLERHPRLHGTRILPNTAGCVLPPVRPFDGRVAVVGDFGSLKRVDWLLEELRDSGCQIHLFGNRSLPERWRHQGIVSHGLVTDLAGELSIHCSLLVMASATEGFPNVLVDAQRAGCAVLLPNAFPFARFPLAQEWRFALEPGSLAHALRTLSAKPRDFSWDNADLRALLERDWNELIEEALV